MRSEYIFYLFVLLTNFGYGATMTLYTPLMVDMGLGYDELAILNVVFQGTMVGLEVPTGVIADRYGRAISIVLGTFVLSVGGFCYTYSSGFWSIMGTEILCGLGFCCISGALNAWVIDARDRVAEIRVVLSTGASVRTAGLLVGNTAAVYLAPNFGTQVGFSMMGVAVGTMCVLAFVAMRPRDVVRPTGQSAGHTSELQSVIRKLKDEPSLRWALAMTALMGTMVNFNLYWVLFMRPRLSMPELGWMGTLVFVGVGIAPLIVRSAIGGKLTNGRGHLIAGVVAGVALSCFTSSQSTVAWAALLLVLEIGRGIYDLCKETFIHVRIEEQYRATFGSVTEFVAACGCGVTLLVTTLVFFGKDPDPSVIPSLWLGTGLVCLTGTLVLSRYRPY